VIKACWPFDQCLYNGFYRFKKKNNGVLVCVVRCCCVLVKCVCGNMNEYDDLCCWRNFYASVFFRFSNENWFLIHFPLCADFRKCLCEIQCPQSLNLTVLFILNQLGLELINGLDKNTLKRDSKDLMTLWTKRLK